MLDHGAPALGLISAWTSAMTDCATMGARLWWGAATQASELMSGQARAAMSVLLPAPPRTRSWYRAPDHVARAANPYAMAARLASSGAAGAGPDWSAALAPWWAASLSGPWLASGPAAWSAGPLGAHQRLWGDAMTLALRNPFAAAWMEGAGRAFLPPMLATASEIARRPSSGIPYVSYRSDGGHAVAQIAFATTSAMIAAGPAVMAWLDAVAPSAAPVWRM